MNSFEQFYIQLYSYNNKLVPKQCTWQSNPLYRHNKTFDCVTIARNLHSCLFQPSLPYFSSVPFR